MKNVTKTFKSSAKKAAYQFVYNRPESQYNELCQSFVDQYNQLKSINPSDQSVSLETRIKSLHFYYCRNQRHREELVSTIDKKVSEICPNSPTTRTLEALRNDSMNPILRKEVFLNALENDIKDLNPFRFLLTLDWLMSFKPNLRMLTIKEKQQIVKMYCRKAVEEKQWDHIYFLTADQYYGALEPYPRCKAADDLVQPHWSEEYKNRHFEYTEEGGIDADGTPYKR
ncbi:MAG TPA: hypothetical protein V6C96_05200 [Vampirovibrionales bacterium]